jgi:hypothetical protein
MRLTVQVFVRFADSDEDNDSRPLVTPFEKAEVGEPQQRRMRS